MDLRDAEAASMIDSRERNSADGSLVQKARRQVEIFQSQENGGRSVQVVRASQWSSSRATDRAYDFAESPAPRSGALWRAADPSTGASDLDRLSCLCRRLHEEALDATSRLWSSPGAALREPEAGRRSNSTEDVSGEDFARDCGPRRSLQIRLPGRLVAERTRRFEEAADERGPSNKTVVHLGSEDGPEQPPPPSPALEEPGAKPVKRVEFCKTEIHFAADSGKVNIVETDGKPPPTNKFRRRRRANAAAAAQKAGMPLVHFGDTSYEKYIFAGQGKPPEPPTPQPSESRRAWSSPDRLDRAGPRNARGAHTTTVSFLNDAAVAVAVPKLLEDKASDSFPTTNHVARKEIGSLAKRSTSKKQVLAEDSDKNQVLLKIVTTHKPMLARVENDHSPLKHRSSSLDPQEDATTKPQSPDVEVEQKEPRGSPSVLASSDLDTKDDCDITNGANDAISDCDEAPTYENIFDAISNGEPVYENFQLTKIEPIERKAPTPGTQTEKSATNSYDGKGKKLSSKLANGSSADESAEKGRIKTPVSSPTRSGKSASRSVAAGDDPSKNGSRSSGARDNSIKRYKDAKPTKDDTARGTQAKRKNSSKAQPILQEHKATPSAINTEKIGGTIRSKKPVQVVYQTAVFNMKNEKLSKPIKAKEIKGPRLINDLICGSKLRRPSDSKKVIKTAIMSQNTSKRKETPTSVHRQ